MLARVVRPPVEASLVLVRLGKRPIRTCSLPNTAKRQAGYCRKLSVSVINRTKAASSAEKDISKDGEIADEEYKSFRKGYLQALDDVLTKQTGKSLSSDQVKRINAEATKISEQLTGVNDSDPRTINIDFASSIVAPYRILKVDGYPIADIKHFLHAAMETSTAPSTGQVRHYLDNAKDPFVLLVDWSKDKEKHFYVEPDFEHARARDDAGSYHVDIRKCWYMDTLAKLDASEIGSVFCKFDKAWYSAIDPGRHAFKFTRPTTIAEGFDRCQFNFDRVSVKGAGPSK